MEQTNDKTLHRQHTKGISVYNVMCIEPTTLESVYSSDSKTFMVKCYFGYCCGRVLHFLSITPEKNSSNSLKNSKAFVFEKTK